MRRVKAYPIDQVGIRVWSRNGRAFPVVQRLMRLRAWLPWTRDGGFVQHYVELPVALRIVSMDPDSFPETW